MSSEIDVQFTECENGDWAIEFLSHRLVRIEFLRRVAALLERSGPIHRLSAGRPCFCPDDEPHRRETCTFRPSEHLVDCPRCAWDAELPALRAELGALVEGK